MKTNISIIKKLAEMGVLDTEPARYIKEGDIIIKDEDDCERRIILEDISDEDLPLMIAAEQLRTVKYIKSVVKGYVIISCLAMAILLLCDLIQLGSKI